MKTFFLTVLGLGAALIGVVAYRSSKTGKGFKQQFSDDMNMLKQKAAETVKKTETVQTGATDPAPQA